MDIWVEITSLWRWKWVITGPIPFLFFCPKNWSKFSWTRVRLTQLHEQRYLWERVCPAAEELLHVLLSFHTHRYHYFPLPVFFLAIVFPHFSFFSSVFSCLLLLYSLVPSFLSILPLSLSMIQLRKNGQGAPTQTVSYEADCVNIPHTLQWVLLRRAGGESF